jgi:hypothetical protein
MRCAGSARKLGLPVPTGGAHAPSSIGKVRTSNVRASGIRWRCPQAVDRRSRDMALLTKELLEIEEGGRVCRLCGFG